MLEVVPPLPLGFLTWGILWLSAVHAFLVRTLKRTNMNRTPHHYSDGNLNHFVQMDQTNLSDHALVVGLTTQLRYRRANWHLKISQLPFTSNIYMMFYAVRGLKFQSVLLFYSHANVTIRNIMLVNCFWFNQYDARQSSTRYVTWRSHSVSHLNIIIQRL